MVSFGPKIFLVTITIVRITDYPTKLEVVPVKLCNEFEYKLPIVISPVCTVEE